MSTTVVRPRVKAPDRASGTRARLDVKLTPYLMIAPFFLLFFIFGLFPLAYNLVVSLRVWRLDEPKKNDWAGLDNFIRVFSDGRLLQGAGQHVW